MTGFIEKGEGGLLPRDREKGKPFTDGERDELTCLQTKESQRFPAATSISERDIENTLKGNQPCQHLDFRLLASRAVRGQVSAVLGHLVYDAL